MPCFTQELSCTDGSTDASIFSPSVHPMLHWSVGPTCHIRRRPLVSIQTQNLPAATPALYAAALLTSGDSPAYVHALRHLPTLPPPPRARCRPPRHAPAPIPRACAAKLRRLAGDHKGGAQSRFLFHIHFSSSPSSCGEHKQNFPSIALFLGLHCTVPASLRLI
jgi:hypothetical protein